jgi:hypothetical protein
LLHPGPLVADGRIEAAIEPGASTALDLAAAADEGCHAFLRAAWFGAAAGDAAVKTLVGRDVLSGEPLAAIPLIERRFGPLSVREVPGSYWPYRSFPIAAGASESDLAALLASPAARAALGRAWRVGPIYADDPAAAAGSGGAVVTLVSPARLGTCFILDLADGFGRALAEQQTLPRIWLDVVSPKQASLIPHRARRTMEGQSSTFSPASSQLGRPQGRRTRHQVPRSASRRVWERAVGVR